MTRFSSTRAILVALAATTLFAPNIRAQTDGTCVPAAERGSRTLGCFVTAREELGRLSASPPLFWHLETYQTREAAVAARSTTPDARSTIVQSLGRTWLFTIAPAGWRARGGTHVARIGPLPLVSADSFAAVYMEGVFEPGMQSVVHDHPGAEAWYTLEGSMCLETPDGKLEQRAGDPGVLVRGGLPMVLTGTGTSVRRSVVLILQDATKPRSSPVHSWTPRRLCR
jgi:hypothetical protein